MKIPNILTIIRLLIIPVIGALLYSKNPIHILISFILFVIAVLTDWADGVVAKKLNQRSIFGTFFDPIVDKVLILTIFFISSDLGIISLWIVLLFLFRELLVTGIRQVCSKPKKVVGANWMGKTKFNLQSILAGYIHAILYLELMNMEFFLITRTIAYYFALIVVIVSLLFAFNFLYWHRKEILKGL